MSATLIIAEKPKSAKRIAFSIANSKVISRRKNQAVFYELEKDGKLIFVAPVVGHAYTLKTSDTSSYEYPVFNVKWAPTYRNKEQKYIERYIKNIKDISKKCSNFINACDYDIEGSVIGYNVLKYACKLKDPLFQAKRMKFSTLTTQELRKSFDQVYATLDSGLVEAGLTRHVIDWYYGINLSRALSLAVKNATGKYFILSTGRVQGPTLAILLQRESEIQKFKLKSYFEIKANFQIENRDIHAIYVDEKIEDESLALAVIDAIIGKKAKVTEVTKKIFTQPPPTPFDLTTLQIEAYKFFKYTPLQTQNIAQDLYESGLISYPRTASQKLPPEIGFREILEQLSTISAYKPICKKLLNTNLVPHEGKKKDPAHPAIFPTGEKKEISGPNFNLYNLIVHRFFSVFGKSAVCESTQILFDIGGKTFLVKGIVMLEPNWYDLYGPFSKFKEISLPRVKKGAKINVLSLEITKKDIKPPRRYTSASIVKRLEKENIGTKATRASIIDTLYARGYIEGKSITVTKLGYEVVDTLSKYCPRILSIELTRDLEVKIEEIRQGKKKKDEILSYTRKLLVDILKEFKKNQILIGKGLSDAAEEVRSARTTVGVCPFCNTAKLRIIRSKKTKKRFVACSGYPKCKTCFPLPQTGNILPLKEKCAVCSFPVVLVAAKGKKPWPLCINNNCKSKNKVDFRRESGEKKEKYLNH
jgi:DNA topoisomerase-1